MKTHSPKTSAAVLPHPAMYKLPMATFDNHVAILGKTGSGKTFTAKGIAENLLDTKQRLCVIDPTDVWWGMRSEYPVVVFGGRRGDLPLPANSGALLADIVAKNEINVIVSTKLLTVRERTQWFTDFAEALMRVNTGKLHLIIDEAHNFMPQGKVLSPQAGMMLAAGNELLSGGRSQGLCIIMITQRPAKLHKDSLTQAEALIAMRLIAPQDRKAVMEWMGEWVQDPAQGKDLLQGMPSLRTGEGWFWAPEQNILKKTFFPRIKSFDSSAAPKKGALAKIKLQKIDLPAIEAKLGAAADEVKANDPKLLKAEIQRLKAELQKAPKAAPLHPGASKAELKAAFEEGWKEGHKQAAIDILKRNQKHYDDMKHSLNQMQQDCEKVASGLLPGKAKVLKGAVAKIEPPKPAVTGRVPSRAPAISNAPKVVNLPGAQNMPKANRSILTVLAQSGLGSVTSKRYVAVRSNYAINGGGFNNAISSLNSAGYIERNGDMLRITDEGLSALGDYTPLPTGEDLQRHWLSQLSKAESLVLEYLCGQYPSPCDKMTIAAATGYEAKGGGFNNAISKLRTLQLIEDVQGGLRASAELF